MRIFSDEAGFLPPGRRQSLYFGLGGLVMPDNAVDPVRTKITELREKNNYFCNFEYKTGNKHKIPFCKDLLDWYFSYKNIGFFAVVLRIADLDWSYWTRGSQAPYNACYTYFYRFMVKRFYADYIKNGVELRIIIDRQSTSPKAWRNRRDYFTALGPIAQVEERDSYNEDLLQFVDFMLSSTVSIYTLFEDRDTVHSHTKLELNGYLLKSLGVKCFWNWRRVGETWGLTKYGWVRDRKYPDWERPNVKGTRGWAHKFDLFSWHGK